MRNPRWTLSSAVAVIGLLAFVLALYMPGLSGGFIFDDFPNLVRDPDWKLTGLETWQFFRLFSGGISSASGRPLAMLTFGLNHLLGGMDPWGYKFGGVLLHALNAMLFWSVFRRLCAWGAMQGWRDMPGRWGIWLLALAWALHPLQVSTVLYVVQRMEVGATTGILLALLAYMRLREARLDGRRAWPWGLMLMLAWLVGLGFKETALLVPGYALLIELVLYRFKVAGGGRDLGLVTGYAVLAGLAAALAAWLVWHALTGFDASASARSFSPLQRVLTQGPVLLMYLKQIVLPFPESLTFYYDNFPVSNGVFSPLTTVLAWVLLAGLLLLAWCVRRRWPLTLVGVAWFFLGHVLTSNVIMLELAFEHRNYLPMAGILMAVVQPLCWLGRRIHADARATVAFLPVAGLSVLCMTQAATWGDPLRLDWTLENRNPTSPRASYALGARLLGMAKGDVESPQWSMARQQLRVAAGLPFPGPLPSQALIIMDARAGRDVAPEEWRRFAGELTRRALSPEAAGALYAVSQCRIAGECNFESGQLLEVYLRVIKRNPANPGLLTQYANFVWNVLGDHQLAIQMQREAVGMAAAVSYRVALAKFLLADGQGDEGRALLASLEAEGGVAASDLTELRELARRLPERS